MTIRYSNGHTVEAVLLSRTGQGMRVAIKGSEDVAELTDINRTWVTDDCEPVEVEFGWEHKSAQPVVTEADCICPPELAARLIHLLLSGSEEGAPEAQHPPAAHLGDETGVRHVI